MHLYHHEFTTENISHTYAVYSFQNLLEITLVEVSHLITASEVTTEGGIEMRLLLLL